jgi:transcriptional regulator with XRE-family HTH domain
MKRRVDPERLNAAMARKGLSVKGLARKASSAEHTISERTISRLRSGKEAGGVRLQTIEALASALDMEPGRLTGELPAPDADQPESSVFPETRWNIRLPTAIRNAYSLVAIRYRIPAARIVELAPLIFLLMAEQSLTSRKHRLKEMREAFAARQELAWQARHLPLEAAFDGALEDIYDAEQSSIDQRDLFAEALLGDEKLRTAQFYDDYDEEEHNPFAAFLRVLAVELGAPEVPIEVGKVSRDGAQYKLCREHALALADGDEALADNILDGSLPLHELPSELRRGDTKSARLEWFRQKAAERHEASRQCSNVALEDLL